MGSDPFKVGKSLHNQVLRITSSIKNRLPDPTEGILLFGWCVFLIHFWAIITLLQVLPSWALRLGAGELIAVAAYPMVFALLESILVWCLLVIGGMVLPKKILRIDFTTQSAIFLFTVAVTSASSHILNEFASGARTFFWIILILGLGSAFLLSFLAGKADRIFKISRSLLSRVVVLSGIYLLMDFFSLLVVLLRNL